MTRQLQLGLFAALTLASGLGATLVPSLARGSDEPAALVADDDAVVAKLRAAGAVPEGALTFSSTFDRFTLPQRIAHEICDGCTGVAPALPDDGGLVVVRSGHVVALRLRRSSPLDASLLLPLRELVALDLRETPVSHVEALAELPKLLFVDVSKSTVRDADVDAITRSPTLLALVATHDALSHVDRFGPHLKYADLSFNALTSIPAGGPALETWLLESNPIERLSVEEPIPALSQFDLAFCRIASIDAASFPDLPSLALLQLWGNRLTALPDLPPKLAYVGVGQNPLDVVSPGAAERLTHVSLGHFVER